MQLRNRIYPYPVLMSGGDYYNNSHFSTKVSQTIEGYNVKLCFSVDLNDERLLELIKKGDALYVHHIECSQTCFRKIIKTKDNDYVYVLKDTDVNGLVQVCSFIVANTDIENYTNSSFSADYRGWKFNIEKGCILAIGNQYSIRINKQKDDLKNTSSIFSVVKSMDPTDTVMSVDLGQQKIVITLPQTTYNQYSSIQSYVDIQPVMHSLLIIPSLSYVFAELRTSGDQLFEYEDYRWFRGLKKACKDIGIILDEEGLTSLDILKVSQLLLDSPIIKAIAFCSIEGGEYED